MTVDVIVTAADKLWKELTGNMKDLDVTAVQLAFTGIETAESGQQSIEGFFKSKATPPSPLKRTRSNGDEVPPEADPLEVMTEKPGSASSTSFVCERCNKVITVCKSGMGDAGADHADTALAKLHMEHNDFHFAQDLASGVGAQALSRPRSLSGTPKRKKTTEPKGIAKFFFKK